MEVPPDEMRAGRLVNRQVVTDERPTTATIEAAAERLGPAVRRTPLEVSDRLSGLLGRPVLLKREDIQVCRSYKIRGAYNLIASLSPEARMRGVICASAGNHAQGVAYSCVALGVHGRIYVPTTTPRQKRQRILAIGEGWIDLVVMGHTYDEASEAAQADCAETNASYAHPFDDPRTIAGQGTVALELSQQHPDPLGTVVIPIGGGGLAAGMALWLRSQCPEVRIVGAEPAGAPSMTTALAAGGPTTLHQVDTFVDGAAVARVGELTYPIVRDLVDEVITVSEGAICTELLDLYQSEGIIAEPAGALASAAARQLGDALPPGPVACIVSGGNNDVSRYAEIVERSLLHEGLRHYFLVTFPQEPGSLRYFLDEVLTEGEDIVVFEYVKKNNRETGPALVGIELATRDRFAGLADRMAKSPLQIEPVPPGSPLFSFLM
jgi:threonine dehydratase